MKSLIYRLWGDRLRVNLMCQRCFHERRLHEHYRKGTDCAGLKGPGMPCTCPAFAWRQPKREWV